MEIFYNISCANLYLFLCIIFLLFDNINILKYETNKENGYHE